MLVAAVPTYALHVIPNSALVAATLAALHVLLQARMQSAGARQLSSKQSRFGGAAAALHSSSCRRAARQTVLRTQAKVIAGAFQSAGL